MRYILLFRGLNVGAGTRVAMADLAAMLRALGLTDVITYIQSGNALAASPLDEAAVCALVAGGFRQRFGFGSAVQARTVDEWRAAVASVPFTSAQLAQAEARNPQTEHLYLYFLPAAPPPATVEALLANIAEGDQLHLDGRTLYALFADSVRTSPTARQLAKHLPAATARNLRTAQALLALMQ
jgi:uncharacterized protein (DUF1697 family)